MRYSDEVQQPPWPQQTVTNLILTVDQPSRPHLFAEDDSWPRFQLIWEVLRSLPPELPDIITHLGLTARVLPSRYPASQNSPCPTSLLKCCSHLRWVSRSAARCLIGPYRRQRQLPSVREFLAGGHQMLVRTEREPGPLTGGKTAMQRSRLAAVELPI